jgi:hypothetical protein
MREQSFELREHGLGDRSGFGRHLANLRGWTELTGVTI